MTIDPRTYDAIKTASVPHGVGSTFTAMLWEMTWGLIDQYGFDPDLANGSGGNNIATQLVVDGLKLQPCSPGFVDARDAILTADVANNAGVNNCVIWKAFAKRGLGFSADQGSSGSITDGTQAFDLPPECRPLVLTKSADTATAEASGEITYTLTVTNNDSVDQTGVVVSDDVPAGTTYVSGSADCSGGEPAGVVTFPVGTVSPGQSVPCSFRVLVDSSPSPDILLADGFEPDASAWTISHGSGTFDWALDTTNPRLGSNAMFAADPALVADQYLTTASPVSIRNGDELRFWHRYDLEATGGTFWDGGVVEISTNAGATWSDLGSHITQNGYDGNISDLSQSPIKGRLAFSGRQLTYRETIVDLSSYAGQNARIRFRLASDELQGAAGWWIDDVAVGTNLRSVSNTATATSLEGNDATSRQVDAQVIAATPPGAPSGVWGVAGDGEVAVSWTAPTMVPGASVITGYTVTAAPGGATCQATGALTCTVTGLTNGTAYTFTVTGANVAGVGAPSDSSSAVTPESPLPPAPAVPSGLAVSVVSGSTLAVSWGDVVGESAYDLEVDDGGGFVLVSGSPFSADVTSTVVSELTAGTQYCFRVQASNLGGVSGFSTPVCATPVPVQRFEESAAGLVFSSGWVSSLSASARSGGAAVTTSSLGRSVSFTVQGPVVRWVSTLAPWAGKAQVTTDGGTPTEVDLYSPVTLYQRTVFEAFRPLSAGRIR